MLNEILSKIPSKDAYIKLTFQMGNEEVQNLAQEIGSKLVSLGYTIRETNAYGVIAPNYPNKVITQITKSGSIDITVYPLK